MAQLINELEQTPQTAEEVVEYLQRVMPQVAQGLRLFDDSLLNKTHVAPDKTEDGMVRYADGSDWNPGEGQGYYFHDGSSWTKLAVGADAPASHAASHKAGGGDALLAAPGAIGGTTPAAGNFAALDTTGALTATGAVGLDVNPGSDIDADLITVGVTGGPKISWNESEDAFLWSRRVVGSAPLLHVRDEKAANTAGGTFTQGAWRTRVLNTTKTNEIFGASLSSNQVTLPAGEYWCEGMAEAYVVNSHKVKLHDTTNTVDLIIGVSGRTANGGPSTIAGRFTLTGTAVLELQHYCSTTRATDGFGSPTNASVVEAYAELKIWKVG